MNNKYAKHSYFEQYAYVITYFITDHLGSTRVITDNSGNIKEQNDYYPFGMRHGNANLMLSANRWGFNGKERQTTANINYMDYGARMYDDFTGRWFVQDPLQEKYYPFSSYTFSANNPLRFVDPNGMDWYQSNETQYYTWYDDNKEIEGYTYIGEKGSLLGEFETIIDGVLTDPKGFNTRSLYSEGFTFDIVPNDKGALIGSKERDWDLFDEFIYGTGPEFSVFLSDHPYTETMKTDDDVVAGQQYIRDGKSDVPGQVTNWKGKWNVWDALTTPSIAKQFIGSYRYDAFTSSDGKSLNNIISDSKSLHSLLLHATPSSWDKRRSERGEFGNTYQFYIWKSSKK